MRCSIVFLLFAITFGQSLSQNCEIDESEHECGGYCYSAVKPVLEYVSILQKQVESCEAKQPADTLSKILGGILGINEKLESLSRQMAIQQELEKSSQAKIQNLEQQLAAKQEEIPKPKLFKKIGSKNYYIENENKSSWQGALDKCREMGAHLASLQSEEEIKALCWLLKPYSNYWIDLNDLQTEGQYISATTGVKGTFFHWQKNEPNNSWDAENCIELSTQYWPKAGMNDKRCGSGEHFICEKS